MNNINPKKLKLSKWTAVEPINREKHFIVTKVEVEENTVVNCIIEAIISGREQGIDWQTLKDSNLWRIGWK